MKTREELLTEIMDNADIGADDPDGAAYIAVDSTVYAVLEYIDALGEQWGHYDVLGKVLTVLRNNVKQLGS